MTNLIERIKRLFVKEPSWIEVACDEAIEQLRARNTQ